MRFQIEVCVRRGSIVESRHRVHAAVCDVSGALEAEAGESGLVTTFRSAAKPFQALPLVERGHAARLGLDDEQVAILCASHTGSAYHLALVRGILGRLGLGEEALACGFHSPLDAESLARTIAHPSDRSPLYNNCSGKHAGMLALALAEGWPVAGYHRSEHPVQRLLRETLAEVSGVPSERLEAAVDGCNMVVFGLPLAGMARAYARLAAARPGGGAREDALARIRECMRAHPRAVGGAERFSTLLMERTAARPPERGLVAKGGAEGLECAGWAAPGWGVAVKVEDGAMRAVGPATVALLETLGALEADERAALAREREPEVLNCAGQRVGMLQPVVETAAGVA